VNDFQLPLSLRHDLSSAGSAVLPVAVEWVPARPRGGRPASRDRHRHGASSRAPDLTRTGRSRPAGAAARGVPRGDRPEKPREIHRRGRVTPRLPPLVCVLGLLRMIPFGTAPRYSEVRGEQSCSHAQTQRMRWRESRRWPVRSILFPCRRRVVRRLARRLNSPGHPSRPRPRRRPHPRRRSLPAEPPQPRPPPTPRAPAWSRGSCRPRPYSRHRPGRSACSSTSWCCSAWP
jgi:hypothetical protein